MGNVRIMFSVKEHSSLMYEIRVQGLMVLTTKHIHSSRMIKFLTHLFLELPIFSLRVTI